MEGLTMGTKTFDSKCYELAEYFCDDAGIQSRLITTELAAAIQDAVEDFMEVIARQGRTDEA
jgi:hypothetical protein